MTPRRHVPIQKTSQICDYEYEIFSFKSFNQNANSLLGVKLVYEIFQSDIYDPMNNNAFEYSCSFVSTYAPFFIIRESYKCDKAVRS